MAFAVLIFTDRVPEWARVLSTVADEPASGVRLKSTSPYPRMVRQPGGTSPAAPLSKSSLIIRLPPELLLELEELLELELELELEELELDELELDEVELELDDVELVELELDEVELELELDELVDEELLVLVPPQADRSSNKDPAKVTRAYRAKERDGVCILSPKEYGTGLLMTVDMGDPAVYQMRGSV